SSCACTPRAHQLWPSLESACRCEREAIIACADSDCARLKAQSWPMPSLVDVGVRFALTAKLLMSRSCYAVSAKGTGGGGQGVDASAVDGVLIRVALRSQKRRAGRCWARR